MEARGWRYHAVDSSVVRQRTSPLGPTPERAPGGISQHRQRGLSLTELLISQTLTLLLASSLMAMTAGLFAASQDAATRSDQALRARQALDFIAAKTHASHRLMAPIDVLEVSAENDVWAQPQGPCIPPDSSMPMHLWGGVAVLDAVTEPCLAGSVEGQALFLERVVPCPTACGLHAGYFVFDEDCAPLVERAWRTSSDRPAPCAGATRWGRLERLLVFLSHDTASADGVPALKLLEPLNAPPFRWGPAETLVAGVVDWHLSFLPAFSGADGGTAALESGAPAALARSALTVALWVSGVLPEAQRSPSHPLYLTRTLLANASSNPW